MHSDGMGGGPPFELSDVALEWRVLQVPRGLDMFGHGLLWKEHERTFLYPFFTEPLCDMLMYQKCIMRVVLHGWYRPSILQAPLDCDTCMVCHLKMHPRAVFQSKFTTDETCTWCGRLLIYRTSYKAAFLYVSNTAAQTAPCALFNTWKTWITCLEAPQDSKGISNFTEMAESC